MFLAECYDCSGMKADKMGGKCSGLGTINVAGGLGTIKNETQLNVDSRKVRGCLISPGVGGTVQQ